MRRLIHCCALASLLSLPAIGCGGSGKDEVLEYDPEVSEEKSKDYAEEMREAMKNQGRPAGN